MQELERVQRLGDHALIEELIRSAKHDRELTVRMLAELGEVHARGLFRDLGFSTSRAHNALFAERDYGRAFMQARITSSSHSTSVAQP